MNKGDPLAHWRSNPFFVLEISTEASRAEVERAGQKLLALLTVGRTAVEHYHTPLGPAIRDADKSGRRWQRCAIPTSVCSANLGQYCARRGRAGRERRAAMGGRGVCVGWIRNGRLSVVIILLIWWLRRRSTTPNGHLPPGLLGRPSKALPAAVCFSIRRNLLFLCWFGAF